MPALRGVQWEEEGERGRGPWHRATTRHTMGNYAINARTLNSISVHVARLFTAKARTNTHRHAHSCAAARLKIETKILFCQRSILEQLISHSTKDPNQLVPLSLSLFAFFSLSLSLSVCHSLCISLCIAIVQNGHELSLIVSLDRKNLMEI